MTPSTLPFAALERLRRLAGSPDPVVRLLVRVGLVLAATGLVHVLVWLVAGAPSLAGPVSWRKPIVFGLSTGITTLSVAWLASLLPQTPGRRRAAWTYAFTMSLELALIDLQQWRGVASHFNQATILDGALYSLMGGVILVAVGAVAVLGLMLLRATSVAQDARLAGVFGVAFVLVGALMGIAISVHAGFVLATGSGTPSMVGAAPMKVPHGVALHALQVLPILAWWLARAGVATSDRARLIVRAAIGYALVFGGALLQLLLGRAPEAPAPVAIALVVGGVALLVSPLFRVFAAPLRRPAELT